MDGLKLILWKNFKILSRQKLSFAISIIFPLVIVSSFTVIRSSIKPIRHLDPIIYEAFSVHEIPTVVQNVTNTVYYSPSNPLTDSIMQFVLDRSFTARGLDYKFIAFDREEDLTKAYYENEKKPRDSSDMVLTGVIFSKIGTKRLPQHITYVLKFPYSQRTEYKLLRDQINARPNWCNHDTWPFGVFGGPRSKDSKYGGFPGYFDEGYLYMQHAINDAITTQLLNRTQGLDHNLIQSYDIRLQRFPAPPFTADNFSFVLQCFISVAFTVAFTYSVLDLTREIIHEKSTRLKEFMKIMGLRSWQHWLGWFVRSYVILIVITTLVVFILKLEIKDNLAVLKHSNSLIVFIALAVYMLNVISFSFLFSSLFSDENAGSIASAFAWVFSSPIAYTFIFQYFNFTTWEKFFACCLGPNVSTIIFIDFLNYYENFGEGLQWHNLWHGLTTKDDFSVGLCIMMSALNALFDILAVLYIELAFPGPYGVALPWYFPVTVWFWTGKSQRVTAKRASRSKARVDTFEPEPTHLEAGVVIRGLTKVFGSKLVVNISNFRMYQNQVTSLLGPNGAGKTTTMSILTGLIRPTEGMAWVNSYDVTTEMVDVRRSLGFCPQYNILFDNLTVEEHFKFYCQLKGLNEAETLTEIDRGIHILGLEDKRKTLSKHLSGGMKRKLCVGMALSAGSKVIILDEPTAGMDPAARRSTWDMIQAEKKGRTLILSTHYMEEADLLGDRIAIIAKGEVLCCGSSLFLKSKFGEAYNLTIVKKESACLKEIERTISQIIPSVEFKATTRTEISCTLPLKDITVFPLIFEELETRKEDLGIITFGVGSSSMEEIFVRVTDAHGAKSLKPGVPSQSSTIQMLTSDVGFKNASTDSMTELCRVDRVKTKGVKFAWQQLSALVTKKLRISIRQKSTVLLQIIIPVFGVIIFYKIGKTTPGMQELRERANSVEEMHADLGRSTALFRCLPASTMCQAFKYKLQEYQNVQEVEDTPVVDALLETLTESHRREEGKYLLAFEADLNSMGGRYPLTVFFNNQPFHIPPAALSFVSNGLLQFYGLTNTITTTSYPFDYTPTDHLRSTGFVTTYYMMAISVCYAFTFLGGAYVIQPVSERVSKFKHLQVIAGAKLPLYWLADFLANMISIMTAYFGVISAFIIFDLDTYSSFEVKLAVLVVLLAFGWASITFCMVVSTMANDPTMAYSRILAVCMLGSILSSAYISLQSPELELQSEVSTLHDIFSYVPTYAVGMAISSIGELRELKQDCSAFTVVDLCLNTPHDRCCLAEKGYYDWERPGIGKYLVRMAGIGAISLMLLLLVEAELISNVIRIFYRKRGTKSKSDYNTMELIDADVMEESRRIKSCSLATLNLWDNLIVKDFTKVYKGKFTAVDGLSFGVKKGEVFGLLGVNGAGKTSTFKMLTGDTTITSGDAYINYCSVKRDLRKARSHLGYCPQFDACVDELTGRETLTLFACLKGVPEDKIDDLVTRTSKILLFQSVLDKQYRALSGGNKRKLSTAVAMLGDPSIILLDEPTAGMDPVARSHVWDAISMISNAGTSVLLTSHDMGECESLCSTLAIMVKGHLNCLGSPQHLKAKLCPSYRLVVQLPIEVASQSSEPGSSAEKWEGTSERFMGFMEQRFPGCILRDSHCGFLEYLLPKESTTWAEMFAVMEEVKESFKLEGYSVGQQDLEQVFFNFSAL